MTSRTATLSVPREYGVSDIGDVLSPGATDEAFSLLDIEDVLDPPELDTGNNSGSNEMFDHSSHLHC